MWSMYELADASIASMLVPLHAKCGMKNVTMRNRPGDRQNRTKRGRMKTINRALIMWGSLSGNAESPWQMMSSWGEQGSGDS